MHHLPDSADSAGYAGEVTMERAWNAGWWFSPGPVADAFLSEAWGGPARETADGPSAGTPAAGEGRASWIPVHLPHDMIGVPLNAFDERTFARRGCYAKALRKEDVGALAGAVPDAQTSADQAETHKAAPTDVALFLRFEGVSVSCRVWVNGRFAGSHKGPYTPFEVRIDPFLQPQVEACAAVSVPSAWILVEVDSAEDAGIPPFGAVVDYLAFGGIYRGVSLCARPGAWLDAVWGASRPRGDSLDGAWHLEISVEAKSFTGRIIEHGSLRARLLRSGGLVAEGDVLLPEAPLSEIQPAQARNDAISLSANFSLSVDKPRLWDIDNPFLYDLEISLCGQTGRKLDTRTIRIGFRTAEFGPSGFYLNHRRVFLRGLNRHQEYPYAGYAMGPDAQRRDAEMLKHELGCVIVRTSHYPQSPHFLDACDELGLLVFEELPGWQHVGGATWQEQAMTDLRDMILRDRNHPSIVLWGVRINESQDNHEFYARTNGLSRKLDSYRQTAGVRYVAHSELLEDVYTFNDFTHDGEGTLYITEPAKVLPKHNKRAPYLITEHTGHMFPTKRFDQEERLVAHALRHAHILDAAMANARVAGCIGWCAFDYHTHKDFGSGDRVCYHGVADMFRIPKYAAYVYGSQVAPSERIVLEPASRFAKGERNAGYMLPVHVFTNCDAVDVYRGGAYIARFFPDRAHFANLPHPPVVIDDLIGERIAAEGWSRRDAKLFRRLAGRGMAVGAARLNIWERLGMGFFMLRHKLSTHKLEELVMRYGWGSADEKIRLVGILDGKEVAERGFGADGAAERLVAEADANRLDARDEEEWASTRVVVKALDQYDNTVPFVFEPYTIEVEGPARLIGPPQRALVGGASAFWVAGGAEKGRVRISVSSPRFEQPAVLELKVE